MQTVAEDGGRGRSVGEKTDSISRIDRAKRREWFRQRSADGSSVGGVGWSARRC